MRRPLCIICISSAAGCYLAYYMEISKALYISIIIATAVIAGRYIKKNGIIRISRLNVWLDEKVIFLIILLSLLSGTVRMEIAENCYEKCKLKTGKQIVLCGSIKSIKREKYGGDSVVLSCDRGDYLIKIKGKLVCKNDLEHKDLEGKMMRVKLMASRESFPRNPGDMDYALHLKSKGIWGTGYADASTVNIYDKALGVLDRIEKVRNFVVGKIMENSGSEVGGVIVSLITGDKEYIAEDIYENFRNNGIAHVLSVSGLHVGILYMFIFAVTGRRRRLFWLVAVPSLVGYMAFCSFSAPVVRAGGMILLHLVSIILKKPYDMLSAASFMFLLMIFYNPFSIFNVGFQLSFLGIFSIAVIYPFLNYLFFRKKDRLPMKGRRLIEYFMLTMALQMGLVPYIVYNFNYISLSSIILNPLVIAIVELLLPMSMGLVIASGISECIFLFILKADVMVAELMVGISDILSKCGWAKIDMCSPNRSCIIIYYAAIVIITSESVRIWVVKREWKRGLTAVGMIISIVMLSNVLYPDLKGKADIMFIDVGQGDSVLIKTPSGKVILNDGGGKKGKNIGKDVLKPVLLKNGVKKIDLAMVSHMDEDHYGGIRDLARIFDIEKIAFYEWNEHDKKKIAEETGMRECDMLFLRAGDFLRIDEDVSIEIIYPFGCGSLKNSARNKIYEAGNSAGRKVIKQNDISLTGLLKYCGYSMLLTGDIGEEQEREILAKTKIGACDILKIAHHGSRYSSCREFISRINPKISVIQCGKNMYGHPSPEVMEKLHMQGGEVRRNDEDGAVLLWGLEERRLFLISMRENAQNMERNTGL